MQISKSMRVLAIVAATVASLALLTAWVLSLPTFGGEIDGERLERVRADPRHRDGAFVNIEPQAPGSLAALPRYLKDTLFYDEIRVPTTPPPVVAIDPDELGAEPAAGLRAFWIGHASVLLEIDGVRVLIDPVFSDHASPFAFGPKRFHPPPIALAELPFVDAVVISHDHYDHLDMATVQALADRGTRFHVPLGVGAHLERWGVPGEQIIELAWWEEAVVGDVRFVAAPNRHYSGRGLGDLKATHWASWSILGPHHRVFYSGDTGYSRLFREIGARLGPFDMSFVKIGAYGPGASWTDIHMTPEDAIRVHQDVRARRLFPVHWGTFNLAFHDWFEPVERALAAADGAGVEMVTPRVGERVSEGDRLEPSYWWRSMR